MDPRAKDIFFDALDVEPAKRRAWVERECADLELRQQVLDLLAAHEVAPTFAPPAPAVGSSLFGTGKAGATQVLEKDGDVIGRYQLVRRLGEGGFGVVYLARQLEPVVRDVALKLLKVGMDSAQIAARFDAERQTLARMDHPQIARVFDAGTSDRGRPYFVMEYVDGQPITTYCDERKLNLSERLELLEQVCLAVQHAHQKGVIHRDLKPGNILVTRVDGKPAPKVIDFGIAKAIDTDGEMAAPSLTLEAQIIGTPQYMAPEQATIGPKNVDTRSDVYSLGTVLYELITGSPPFDPTELRRAGLEHICKIVRERTPAKPSTRLSEAVDGKATQLIEIARGSDASRLSRQVTGEIDWIVMKALEKEPGRRYQSAAELGADIRRYLNHEPVLAGPPSWSYQFRKFVRRRRIEVAACAAMSVALVAIAAVSTVKEARARAAELAAIESAEQARVAQAESKKNEAIAIQKADEAARELSKANAIVDFTDQLLGGIGPSVSRGRDTTLLKDLLDKAEQRITSKLIEQPVINLAVRSMIAEARFDLGDYPKAIDTLLPFFEKMRDAPDRNDPERLRAGTLLGTILTESGKPEQALPVFQETVDGYAAIGDATSTDSLSARVGLASALMHTRKYPEALAIDEAVLKQLQDEGKGESDLALLVSNSIAFVLIDLNRMSEASERWERLLSVQQRVQGENHPGTLATMSNLAYVYHQMQRLDQAEKFNRLILEQERKLYEPDHPNLIKSLNNLGALLLAQKRVDDAAPLLEEAQRIAEAKVEPTHRFAMACALQMMNLRQAQGRADEAVKMAYVFYDKYVQKYGARDLRTIASNTILLGTLCDAKRYAEAWKRIQEHGADPMPGDMTAEQVSSYHAVVADTLLGLGRVDEARAEVAAARGHVKMTADGAGSFVSARLLRVEKRLAELDPAATQPTTAPASQPAIRVLAPSSQPARATTAPSVALQK